MTGKNVKTVVLFNEDGERIEGFEIRQDLYQLVKDFLSLIHRNTITS